MMMNLPRKLSSLGDVCCASHVVSLMICGAVMCVLLTPSESMVVLQRDERSTNSGYIDYQRLLERGTAGAEGESNVRNLSQELVDNPDCFVHIQVPRRVGGKCGQIRGGPTYCAVRGFLHMHHEDCLPINGP